MTTFKIVVVASTFSLTSCISLMSMQTARTTKKGETSGYLALGSQGIRFTKKSDNKTEAENQSSLEKIRIPVLEGGLRHGFGESWDTGVRYALIPGTIGIDGKYALSDLSTPFGMAVGVAVDNSSFTSKSTSSTAKVSVTDFSIPFFTSYDFWENSAVYFTPKLIKRVTSSSFSSSGETTKSSDSMNLFGLSTGVRLENFVVEYSMASSFGGQTSSILDQISIGIVMATDNINHHSQYAKRSSQSSREEPSKIDSSDEVSDVTLYSDKDKSKHKSKRK